MLREEFEKLIDKEFPKAVPEKFHHLLKNVAFLVENEAPDANLLGVYHGIPHTARGDHYGVGGTLPDTITLYQKTIEEYAQDEARHQFVAEGKSWPSGPERPLSQTDAEPYIRKVIRETIWHEVAHYLGYDEDQVRGREFIRDKFETEEDERDS